MSAEQDGTAGLQAALAHLLTDESLLDSFDRSGAAAIQDRFRLTEAECRSLTALPVAELRQYAHGLRIRRLRLLETLLPVTTMVVTTHRGIERTISEFCATYPRSAAAEGEEFRERNIEWFTEYVLALGDDDLPPWLADIARYEAIRARLACGRDAHEAAQATAADDIPEPDDEDLLRSTPRLSANVELAEFDHDVLAIMPVVAESPDRTYQPARSYVLTQRLRNWRINGYRLGASAYRVLRSCTGDTTVAAIARNLATPAVLAVVRQAHSQGFLSLKPEGG